MGHRGLQEQLGGRGAVAGLRRACGQALQCLQRALRVAAAHQQVGTQVRGAGLHVAVPVGHQLRRDGQRALGVPGEHEVARRLQAPGRGGAWIGRQVGRAQEALRRFGVAAAVAAQPRGGLDRPRDLLVGSHRGTGQVPRAAWEVGAGVGQRRVDGAPLRAGSRVVGGRYEQRVGQRLVDHQSRRARRPERAAVQPQTGQAGVEHVGPCGAQGGDGAQRQLRGLVEAVDAAAVGVGQRSFGRQRGRQRLGAGALRLAERAWELQQRQRVALPRAHQRVHHRGGQLRAAGQQRPRVVVVEAAERHAVEAIGVDGVVAVARGQQQADAGRARSQAPRGEQHRLQGVLVQPVRVVDDGQQRALLGALGKQAGDRRAQRERVVGHRVAERERGLQRAAGRRFQRGALVQQRTQEREQPAERDLRFRRVPPRAEGADPGGNRDAVQQRRLADARGALDEDGEPFALLQARHQSRHLATLPLPPDHAADPR